MPSQHVPDRGRFITHVLLTLALALAAVFIAARFAPWEIAVGNVVLRSQPEMTHAFPVPKGGQVVDVHRRRETEVAVDVRPHNVILMIGDGMGVGQLSAASVMLHGPSGALAVESAPFSGLVRTCAGNDLATDSGAASTAMATGFKAPKKAISTLADGRRPLILTDAAKAAGLATGILTTSGLADATPAGFLVHADNREQYAGIFAAILETDNDVLMGGTWIHHHKAKRDRAYLDLVDRVDELGAAAGYHVIHEESELELARPPVLALFPPRSDSADGHGPELAVTAGFLLETLARHEEGFFAVIENEVTDAGGHDNSVSEVVAAVREFDEAVALTVRWAARRGDTLVLVTADHDTGGLGIIDGGYDDGTAEVRWATDVHTAQWVPIFAFGPGAELFTGVIENTDIPVLIAELLGIEDFPAIP
jgi:alkaline phosphatase